MAFLVSIDTRRKKQRLVWNYEQSRILSTEKRRARQRAKDQDVTYCTTCFLQWSIRKHKNKGGKAMGWVVIEYWYVMSWLWLFRMDLPEHKKASALKDVMCLVIQSCPTLWDPTDCSPPGSLIHGIFPGKNTGVGCHFLLQKMWYNLADSSNLSRNPFIHSDNSPDKKAFFNTIERPVCIYKNIISEYFWKEYKHCT